LGKKKKNENPAHLADQGLVAKWGKKRKEKRREEEENTDPFLLSPRGRKKRSAKGHNYSSAEKEGEGKKKEGGRPMDCLRDEKKGDAA